MGSPLEATRTGAAPAVIVPVTHRELTFLNGWHKQSNDLPTPLGRAELRQSCS
jgi:hypothetical protein